MLRRINNTKSVSRPGYLVSLDPNNYEAFVYTTPNSTKSLGVITEAVAYRKPCNVATIGDTAQVYVTGNVNKGDILRASKTNDRASLGSCVIAKTGDSPYLRIGEALTSGNGLISCVLDLSYQGTDDAGWVPYVGATQDINIGDHFITGRFVFRPGDPGAGLAPAVFMPGTLLTVPVAGTMEFDGTGLYFTNTNHRRFIALASNSIIATTIATDVVPTLLWTGITNANELKPYRVYIIKGSGLYTTDTVDTCYVTIKIGAVVIGWITTPVGAVTDAPWYLEIFLTVRTIGINGTISAYGRIDTPTGSTYGVLESFIINTTIANDITIVATWSDVGNSLKLTQCWLSTQD